MSFITPPRCKHLYGTLFTIPFDMIRTPDVDQEESDDYKFANPRLNTEKGQADLLDKRLSAELRESIRTRTLLNPLVCRWVKEGDNYYPQLVGGDRRYRALDFLIRKKEIVSDPRNVRLNEKGDWEYDQVSADDAYNTLPCQIFSVNNDLDALALSWAENKNRVDLTEGHEVAEVIKLRKAKASDERILDILQQDPKWLAETDSLISSLDANTLADLLEGRIDRTSAIELLAVVDIETRDKVRNAANDASYKIYERRVEQTQRQVEKALSKQEIAEGAVADAEFRKTGVEEAKATVEEAVKKVKKKVKERDGIAPVTTGKQVRKAKATVGVADIDKPLKILSSKKITLGLEYLDELIANGGKCLKGTFEVNLESIKLVRKIVNNNILANEPDFSVTIKRHVDKEKS